MIAITTITGAIMNASTVAPTSLTFRAPPSTPAVGAPTTVNFTLTVNGASAPFSVAYAAAVTPMVLEISQLEGGGPGQPLPSVAAVPLRLVGSGFGNDSGQIEVCAPLNCEKLLL